MWLVSKQFLPFFFLDNKDHPRIREGKSFYQFWNECSPFFSFPQPSFFIRVKFWNSVLFHFSFLWFPRDFVSFIFLFSLFFFHKETWSIFPHLQFFSFLSFFPFFFNIFLFWQPFMKNCSTNTRMRKILVFLFCLNCKGCSDKIKMVLVDFLIKLMKKPAPWWFPCHVWNHDYMRNNQNQMVSTTMVTWNNKYHSRRGAGR